MARYDDMPDEMPMMRGQDYATVSQPSIAAELQKELSERLSLVETQVKQLQYELDDKRQVRDTLQHALDYMNQPQAKAVGV